MPVLHLLTLCGFAALLAAAAYSDIRRFQIPNAIPIALTILYPLFALTAPEIGNPFAAALVATIVLASGAALFVLGILGGGDVKLLAAASLWVGPSGVTDLVGLTAMIGGVLGLMLLTRAGAALALKLQAPHTVHGDPLALSLDLPPDGPAGALPAAGRWHRPMPYGVAIAAAAVITGFASYPLHA